VAERAKQPQPVQSNGGIGVLMRWAEICAALGGIDYKTARRLELEHGLPVYRKGRTVMTTEIELQLWAMGRLDTLIDDIQNHIRSLIADLPIR
jgi:hypothetical protein